MLFFTSLVVGLLLTFLLIVFVYLQKNQLSYGWFMQTARQDGCQTAAEQHRAASWTSPAQFGTVQNLSSAIGKPCYNSLNVLINLFEIKIFVLNLAFKAKQGETYCNVRVNSDQWARLLACPLLIRYQKILHSHIDT